MTTTPLRAAIVGCGRIGTQLTAPRPGAVLCHAAAYAAAPDSVLVGVCDIDQQAATAAARAWSVDQAFTELPRLLAGTQPEVVSICTPDETHAAVAVEVLRCPSLRAIVLEKPIAMTIADASRVARLAAERGVVMAINYSRRWSRPLRDLMQLTDNGALGPVRRVSGHYANGWLHNGTHWIDLARMLVGDITAVRALTERAAVDSTDPAVDVELEFANGARGVVFSHPGHKLSFFEMDLVCERGRIRVSEGGASIEVEELRPSSWYSGFVAHERVSSSHQPLDSVLLDAVEDVVSCVRTGGEPRCTASDGVAALRIALAARDGAGAWSRLSEAALA